MSSNFKRRLGRVGRRLRQVLLGVQDPLSDAGNAGVTAFPPAAASASLLTSLLRYARTHRENAEVARRVGEYAENVRRTVVEVVEYNSCSQKEKGLLDKLIDLINSVERELQDRPPFLVRVATAPDVRRRLEELQGEIRTYVQIIMSARQAAQDIHLQEQTLAIQEQSSAIRELPAKMEALIRRAMEGGPGSDSEPAASGSGV